MMNHHWNKSYRIKANVLYQSSMTNLSYGIYSRQFLLLKFIHVNYSMKSKTQHKLTYRAIKKKRQKSWIMTTSCSALLCFAWLGFLPLWRLERKIFFFVVETWTMEELVNWDWLYLVWSYMHGKIEWGGRNWRKTTTTTTKGEQRVE